MDAQRILPPAAIDGATSDDLLCSWRSWRVIGHSSLAVDLPPDNCTDMEGSIRAALFLMPHVEEIHVYEDGQLGISYIKEGGPRSDVAGMVSAAQLSLDLRPRRVSREAPVIERLRAILKRQGIDWRWRAGVYEPVGQAVISGRRRSQPRDLELAQVRTFFAARPDEWLYAGDLRVKWSMSDTAAASVLARLQREGYIVVRRRVVRPACAARNNVEAKAQMRQRLSP